MVDEPSLKRALAGCAVRASAASRVGDEISREQALAEADAIGHLLDRLAAEAEWAILAGSPDHG